MDIVPYQDKTIQTYDDIENVAKAMVSSGYFADSAKISQAIVKIMAGREIGLGPFSSMNGIHIIQGKPSFGANVMAGKVKSSGRYNYRVTEINDSVCSIEFMELFNSQWSTIGTSTFTIADAKKAGVKNTDKFPRNMLFARAMSNGVRWYCPDVMNGATVYTPEELGADVDQDGNVINIPVVEVAPIEVPVIEPTPDPMTDFLIDTFAVDKPVTDPMTIEDACKVTTSQGKVYGEMTVVAIEKMLSAMHAKLANNQLTPVEKAEVEHKIKAAQMVYNAKKNQEI
jgi:hypothetical protein